MLDQSHQPQGQAHPVKSKEHPLVKEARESSAKIHENHTRIGQSSDEDHDRISFHINGIAGDHPTSHKATLSPISNVLRNKVEWLSNSRHDELAVAIKEAEGPQVPRRPANTATVSIAGAFRDNTH